MGEWIPFCFPKCPSCQEAWGKNFHKNCSLNGQLLVDPYQRQVRCDSCHKEWISSISYEIGRFWGTTASTAQKLIENFFEKWSF